MTETVRGWWHLACRRSVVRRALLAAGVVGCLQIAINRGDALLVGDVTPRRIVKMILTASVPYMVSTFSSVGALRNALARGLPGTADGTVHEGAGGGEGDR
jgi:hypothetical protein